MASNARAASRRQQRENGNGQSQTVEGPPIAADAAVDLGALKGQDPQAVLQEAIAYLNDRGVAGVLVLRMADDQGRLIPQPIPVGGVSIDQTQTLCELGAKTARQMLGLDP